jgi:hypothetical protein
VKDLLIITPTRGRPQSMMRLAMAVHFTAQADTGLVFAVDADDTLVDAGDPWSDFADWMCGPRDTLGGWTNRVAAHQLGAWRAYASLGDDHIPWTAGWDRLLLGAIEEMGGTGIAYGDDLVQGEKLPTAAVVSADIVAALGWMCEPSLSHFYVDDAWKDLGKGAGCLVYVPEVVIEHRHPSTGKARADVLNAEAEQRLDADKAAYQAWRAGRMAADVATVRALRPVAA